MNVQDQPMLIALVAVQFFVHALGWTMAARLFHGWRAAEGQFAAYWLMLALGLLLPRIGLAEAKALVERMALQIAATDEPRVTISIGVAEVRANDEMAEQVIRRADAALYRAKAGGRNLVVVSTEGWPMQAG